MGNTISNSPRKPLSSNESLNNEPITQVDINQSVSNLKRLIRILENDNIRYNKELLKKQIQAKEYVKRSNMDAARIVAQQVLRYNSFIQKNMKTIEQLHALILKLQETKDTVELKRLVNQSNLVGIMQENPLSIRGGEYIQKLIKYEEKLLGLY
jgi:hypothetical protein